LTFEDAVSEGDAGQTESPRPHLSSSAIVVPRGHVLDCGVPVHVVAERIGDDPAVLLRNYAKRKRKNTADNSVSAVISALAAGFIRP
jgi:hypothetical protein